MQSIARGRVVLAGVLAFNGWVASAGAKTIVVDFHDPAVYVSPARYFAAPALAGLQAGAGLRPVSAPIDAQLAGQRSNLTPLHASFGSPSALTGLYQEARRFALNGTHAAGAQALGNSTSIVAPVQRGDFRAMLLLGALLIAHQLGRKHRSLKQSLIAG
jgi:hypothetical protein